MKKLFAWRFSGLHFLFFWLLGFVVLLDLFCLVWGWGGQFWGLFLFGWLFAKQIPITYLLGTLKYDFT